MRSQIAVLLRREAMCLRQILPYLSEGDIGGRAVRFTEWDPGQTLHDEKISLDERMRIIVCKDTRHRHGGL